MRNIDVTGHAKTHPAGDHIGLRKVISESSSSTIGYRLLAIGYGAERVGVERARFGAERPGVGVSGYLMVVGQMIRQG